ncbi:uncharacterized protein N7459_003898 [Penicillium hispanicum]|uniref:uncharacterized protein n=1 Tax=Penicillium hispanicum TaxID=1080232 RepID=UPI00253F80E8|nr:uncharacterized protein N7459_003898 [Penicillium hispanicum]KAJ5584098.1 hypothetical protein N7459_003898 [Penicillium hispanicum]
MTTSLGLVPEAEAVVYIRPQYLSLICLIGRLLHLQAPSSPCAPPIILPRPTAPRPMIAPICDCVDLQADLVAYVTHRLLTSSNVIPGIAQSLFKLRRTGEVWDLRFLPGY